MRVQSLWQRANYKWENMPCPPGMAKTMLGSSPSSMRYPHLDRGDSITATHFGKDFGQPQLVVGGSSIILWTEWINQPRTTLRVLQHASPFRSF
jgi:hypothetical protein